MPTPAADTLALSKSHLSHLMDGAAALASHAELHARTADLPHAGLPLVHEADSLTRTVRAEHEGSSAAAYRTGGAAADIWLTAPSYLPD